MVFVLDIYNYTPGTSHDSRVGPIQCRRYSAATVFGISNVISFAKHFVILYYYFPKYVSSSHYGCFLQFLHVVLIGYVVRVYSELFIIITTITNFFPPRKFTAEITIYLKTSRQK
jgi:hypothetical protein